MLRHLRITGLLLCAWAAQAAAQADDAPVRTAEGPLSGTTVDGVRAFKGIPYAAPPVGPLRWKPPQPVTPWKQVRSAAEYPSVCIQPGGGGAARGAAFSPYGGAGPRTITQSEDCLYLNLWTAAPSHTGNSPEKRPVMLWIHGGGFQAGTATNPEYDGSSFARKGVVLITVGYRLGSLGFLALPELSAESEHKVSGNYGILDLIASLQWVQRNVAAFGGDPGNVTVFGQSGGSWGVCYLTATPLAKGLFHRGIAESGCVFDRIPHLREPSLDQEPAEKMGRDWVKRVLGAEDKDLSLESLRAKPATSFNKFVAFTGIVDGWVVPTDIYSIFYRKQQNMVPIIGGNTSDEGTVTTMSMREATPDTYETYVKQLRKTWGEDLGSEIVKQYRLNGPADVKRVTAQVFRDSRQVWQMRMLARLAAAANQPSYLYYFTRVPPGPRSEEMGAYHAAEIPYVFGNFIDQRRPYAEVDHKLAEIMSSYWINFARTGDPNGPGLPKWPLFNSSTELCQEFGETVKTIPAPNKPLIDIFDRYESPRLAKERM